MSISYGKQDISDSDIEAVVSVLKSELITQGPQVPLFEKSLADYVDVDYAIAVNSATSALQLSCFALGVGKGDLVWTSPNSFVASSNCALLCGADVDFIDVEVETGNISILELKKKLNWARNNNKLPKVVIPVHFAGQSCDMQALHKLSTEFGFRIIEDASHALGAEYHGKKVGCCEFSDLAVFSFHPVKMITTGEGGMVVTNDENLSDKIRRLRTHGIQAGGSEPWSYEQVDLGFNYRMSDIHAALGVQQLKKLDWFIEQRQRIVNRYYKALKELPITTLEQKNYGKSSWHLFVIQLPKAKRKQVFEFMRKHEIYVQVHYIPIHTQPYYQSLGFAVGDFPNCEKYYETCLSIPIYPTLTDDQQVYVVELLARALNV